MAINRRTRQAQTPPVEVIDPALSREEARRLTDEVRGDAEALLAKLWRLYQGAAHLALGYPSWGAYFAAEFAQSGSRGYQLLDAARVMELLDDSTTVERPNERQARELLPLAEDPGALRAVWRDLVELYGARLTAKDVREAVLARLPKQISVPVREPITPLSVRVRTVVTASDPPVLTAPSIAVRPQPPAAPAPAPLAVHFSSESAEWCTPPEILARVAQVLGAIDLDPCAEPERRVPAVVHFTVDDDGLQQPWHGRVFMNPPYGRDIEPWVQKLADEYAAGRTTEAVALVPARVDTQWFRVLGAFPVCFVTGRLRFSGHENSAPFPSALVYLGEQPARFAAAFRELGDVYRRWDG